MSIIVALQHRTSYHYPRPASLSPQIIRLRPAPHTRTPILSYSLTIEPPDHFLNWQQDPFGNHLARLVVPERTDHLIVTVDLVAELVTVNPFDFFLEPEVETIPFDYEPGLAHDLAPYRATVETWGPDLDAWYTDTVASCGLDPARPAAGDGVDTVSFLLRLTQRLADTIRYEIRYEPGVQSSKVTVTRAAGSCRDSAWLLVETLRRLGLAARFVSGYLVQLTPDVKPLDGPGGPDADFTDLHAWTEVFLPGAGWVGLDATSGLAAGEGHIPLVASPEPQRAAPITGSSDIAADRFDYANEVVRLQEAPRSTLPYDNGDWERVVDLGHQVDEVLTAEDVRLTMGGEPTFVSADDFESEQWTTAADGADKRRKARALSARLHDRFAPGGVVQHGQGKWYPGEPLPRWEIRLVWRLDGVPVWQDRSRLADPSDDLGHDHTTARTVAEAIAGRFAVPADLVRDTYEDPVYGLWREASLPVDVDPTSTDLDDEDQRRALMSLFDGGLGGVVGTFFPLGFAGGRWQTSTWPLRRAQVFLTPGTSPMGMRLPLDTLPTDPETWPDAEEERDPLEDRGPLAPDGPSGPGPAAMTDPVIVRTALAVEARDGVVRIFLPPLPTIEAGLTLLHTVEDALAATGVTATLEGYALAYDPRVDRLSVTPDPGVIEVNVPPARSWDELYSITDGLYDDARQVGLATEKFHLDGRHTGTGGGNHITIGGPTPRDSPLLRNPALLASMITYWQHHPSLSYAFSGMFVGPTSQSPRVDEARHENLHELEIALGELDRAPDPSPWLADRALRHLLTDLTGNTHRAELCIDKLYSPDHARGRLGLLELRAFEMPPHPRMAMVQYLMVRAIVARLWNKPYRMPLVRWGTDLHDRYLLPHYLAEDARAVTHDLNAAGFAFDAGWLEPFFEFRFPRYGTIVAGGTSVELRAAIEPWLVLGEEARQNGTARYVDSSMERLQVKTHGFVPGRHALLVNRTPVPLRPTGRPGEEVAGIRYRAWHPPSALHPTIGVHHPLTFEIVDRWSRTPIGGARYHVAHPGGRAYDILPVNALEAEARRQSRFDDWTVADQARPEPRPDLDGPGVGDRLPRPATAEATVLEPFVADESPEAEVPVDVEFPVTFDLRGR
ncbi:MAG: DUF2126 domain-containing protein [Acidimicrobiales bacterium]